jgi:CDP-diacylglycerol--serine O-phosphatidyltransferase
MPISFSRSLLPNMITCLGLACAGYAIFLILEGDLFWGGALVIITALMDGIDGELARRLNASSEIGVQLDSLADVVCFGVAPAVLMTQYLRGTDVPSPVVWIAALIFLLCSALRLARFNTLASGKVMKDSLGLPTTAAGSYLTLLIYWDFQSSGQFLAAWFIPFAAVVLSALMVSEIHFLSKTGRKGLMIVSLIATVILGILVSLPLAGLIFLSLHIAHGLLRALWEWWHTKPRRFGRVK